MIDEESVRRNCFFSVRAVICDSGGVPYLLVSSQFEGAEQMELVVYETRAMSQVPVEVLKELGVENAEVDDSEGPGYEGTVSEDDDEVIIFSVAQGVDGAMFFAVGKRFDLPDAETERDEGDEGPFIGLWIYAIADKVPSEVIAQVDRIARGLGADLEPEPVYEF